MNEIYYPLILLSTSMNPRMNSQLQLFWQEELILLGLTLLGLPRVPKRRAARPLWHAKLKKRRCQRNN